MKYKYNLTAFSCTGLIYNYYIECEYVTLADILAGALLDTKAYKRIEIRRACDNKIIEVIEQ